MTKRIPHPCTMPTRCSGFSMVEMMISITIGMVIVAALVGVLTTSSGNSKSNDRTSELQSNGRFALDYFKGELRQAGYRGYTWAEPNAPTTTITPIVNECLPNGAAATAFVTNLRQGVWGANDSNPYTASCLPAANRLRGDVLVIRRVENTPLSGTTVNNTLYFRSSYAFGEIFRGDGVTAATTGTPSFPGQPPLLDDFRVRESVYYIGKDDTDTTLPALRQISLKGSGDTCNGAAVTSVTMCDEMLVTGIEHMEVQFGRFDTALNTQYLDAGAISGTSTDTPTSLPSYAWNEVKAVRIWLLARTAKPETGYTNTTSYVMGDQTYTVNDSYRRQLFTAVVRLRN